MSFDPSVPQLFIDGGFVAGIGGGTAVVDPATLETVGVIAEPTAAEVDRVVARANAAQAAWAALDLKTRAALLHRVADHLEGLGLGAVDEPTGVDDHDVRVVVLGRDFVPFGAQLGQDALGVDQGLGTAQRHESHARRAAGSRSLRRRRDRVQGRAVAVAGGAAGAFAGPGSFKNFQSGSP